jgi:hypothetical protein
MATAKERRQFIDKFMQTFEKKLSELERLLLRKIIDKFIKEYTEAQSLTSSGKAEKLSNAVKSIYDSFKGNQNIKLINDFVKQLEQLADLQDGYFNSLGLSRQMIRKAEAGARIVMREKIGINANGTVKKGSFIHKYLMKDDNAKRIQSIIRSSVIRGSEPSVIINRITRVVTGTKEQAGVLTHHYRTFAYDTMQQYDAEYGKNVAVEIGLKYFIYSGGTIETTRDFCKSKAGKVFSIDEAQEWRNDPKLLVTKDELKKGRKDYDPIVDRGRWNCRHTIEWITEEEAFRRRPELRKLKTA